MELQCDICFIPFDLDGHRPKCLPCGHSICQECVQNPALLMKCPTCRKDMSVDPRSLPDNILAIRMIEHDGAPPCKKAKTEMTQAQRMRRGVEAAREVVASLRLMVPQAIQGLRSLLNTSADRLCQMEEALEREVRREAGGGPSTPPEAAADAFDALRVAMWMDDSRRAAHLLKAASYTLSADEDLEPRKTWKASWKQQGADSPVDSVVRLLLLLLQSEKRLKQDADVLADDQTPFVGPPMVSVLAIGDRDLNDGDLQVNEILRKGRRWKHIRILRNLKGHGLDKLLRVVGTRLEELEISGNAEPAVMEEVEKMHALKRLSVRCNKDVLDDYPDLPMQLEELSLHNPSENQMLCVQRMPKLRSLRVYDYLEPNMTFPPSPYGALLWLGVGFNTAYRAPMFELIRSYAASLQELQVYCSVDSEESEFFYFPDLGLDLAGCGLKALRRLVLRRSTYESCADVASCLLQRRTIRGFLSPSVEVICDGCADACQVYT